MSKKKKPKQKTWHGKPLFQCDVCPWSTLHEEEMVSHTARHHAASSPRVQRVDTGLVGPGGGKIVREEIVEPVEPVVEEETNG